MKYFRKTIAYVMAAVMLFLCGCGAVNSENTSDKAKKTSKAQRHKVIIDTDTGSDDGTITIE